MVLGGDAVRDVVSDDVDTGPFIDRRDLPGHRHRASEGRVVGDEVDGLNDPDVRNDLDVASLDDVGLGRGLSRSARGVGVGQDQSVGASGSRIEPLEPGRHPVGWEPSHQRLAVHEGGVDMCGRGGDHPRCGVRARHA